MQFRIYLILSLNFLFFFNVELLVWQPISKTVLCFVLTQLLYLLSVKAVRCDSIFDQHSLDKLSCFDIDVPVNDFRITFYLYIE